MFKIELRGGGKRYNTEWIFRSLDLSLQSGQAVVFLGGNGSGKSTALRTLAGYASLTEGELAFRLGEERLKRDEIYRHISFCAPYLDLYEELTLNEFARFHFSLKPARPDLSQKDFANLVGLESASDKAIKYFSSGMKQRVRLGMAIFSHTDMVFLDEPTVNLDARGVAWYRDCVESYREERIFVVASNRREEEFFFCDQKVEIEKYKPA